MPTSIALRRPCRASSGAGSTRTTTSRPACSAPRVEPLYILGGETFWDNFIIRTQGRGNGAFNHKTTQWEMKSRALSREYSRAFFEGDDLVDPDEMPGLRRRLTGNQVLLAGTNGASLTVAMIDELIDDVIAGDTHLFMHKTLRRKLTSPASTQGGTSATYRSPTAMSTRWASR
jgi:hypothetical protein